MLLFVPVQNKSKVCILKLSRNPDLDSLKRVLPQFSKTSVGSKKKAKKPQYLKNLQALTILKQIHNCVPNNT